MLDVMRREVPAVTRIDTVVNTHANGAHCWGNQVFSDSRIIASRAAAAEIKLGVPRIGALTEGAEFAVACFGEFDIGNVKLTLPTQTFDGELTLDVGTRRVSLLEVGPAHTKGDVIAFLPWHPGHTRLLGRDPGRGKARHGGKGDS